MMLNQTLVHYTGTPAATIEQLLQLGSQSIYRHPTYQDLVASLNRQALEATLPLAREAYNAHLPDFIASMQRKHKVSLEPMSAFTLANWLVGFLQYPATVEQLPTKHERIPKAVIREGLPELLAMLDDMPQGRAEWQRALAILALPLVLRD